MLLLLLLAQAAWVSAAESLAERLQPLIADHHGVVAVAIKHLEDG